MRDYHHAKLTETYTEALGTKKYDVGTLKSPGSPPSTSNTGVPSNTVVSPKCTFKVVVLYD